MSAKQYDKNDKVKIRWRQESGFQICGEIVSRRPGETDIMRFKEAKGLEVCGVIDILCLEEEAKKNGIIIDSEIKVVGEDGFFKDTYSPKYDENERLEDEDDTCINNNSDADSNSEDWRLEE